MTDKALEAALKACPFCGGEGSVHWNMATGKDFVVLCNDACLSSTFYYRTEPEAIAAWNRRAPLSALPGEAEAVGKLLWRAEETRADLLTHHRKEAEVVGELADALQVMHARAEAAESHEKDAMGLLDHLIGWIVHDCGAEPPFTSEQDETYVALCAVAKALQVSR